MKKFIGGVILFLSVLLLLPGIRTKAADGRTIANGIYIGDIDVSGMTVSDATAAVHSCFDKMAGAEITLDAGEGRRLQIYGEELGISWKNPQIIEEAYSLGHKGNIIQRYKALKDLEKEGHRFEIEYGFSDEHLQEIVGERCSSFNQDKVNFALKKTSDGFTVSQGQTGYVVDVDQSIADIKNFVQSGWNGDNAVVALAIKEDVPLGSAEDLAKVKDVLGTYTTSYKTSGSSRSANVANGCSLINGTTLYPGEIQNHVKLKNQIHGP